MLRPLTLADAPAVRRIFSGSALAFLGRPPMTDQDAEAYVSRVRERARAVPVEQYVLGVDPGGGPAIGIVKLGRRPNRHGRVSYILRDDCWGHGYATQAVRELIDFAFGTTHFGSLGARHHPDNHASGRVLIKAGFVRLGTQCGMAEYYLRRKQPCRT